MTRRRMPAQRPAHRRVGLATALAACVLVAGCTGGDAGGSSAASPAPRTGSSVDASAAPVSGADPIDVDDPALDLALSTPVEDRVYPQVGDPGVDALSYDLDLAWAPDSRTLTAHEAVVFRSTTDAGQFQLDLGRALEVSSVRLDGQDVAFEHTGKDLVVQAAVVEDERYTLDLDYSGTPRPVAAPTTRSDFSTVGWTITDRDEVWTMQEPFGAYSWYAVNDQPSDKALYSFTITAPSPMVGVANGELLSREEQGPDTVTEWRLDEPAASYLVTVAIGRFEMTEDRSPSGVPITYWTRPGNKADLRRMRVTPEALDWVEQRLGPYPFSTLGIVLVDSNSGMETQTMITLGRTRYTTSREVILHEIVHQWYGDEITPTDWRDVWMSEGIAMYLQGIYEAERSGQSLDSLMRYWASFEPQMRRESGPPADYDPATFGEGNIYYGPALMWHALRKKIGDDTFWEIIRAWPQVREDGNANREQFIDWLNEQTGRDLTAFYDSWLLDRSSPAR